MRARARLASSRRRSSPLAVTNLVCLAGLVPSMMARARASWALRVAASRRARLVEYCQTARHALGCSAGTQTGSARSLMLLTRLRECFGVTVSMICPAHGGDSAFARTSHEVVRYVDNACSATVLVRQRHVLSTCPLHVRHARYTRSGWSGMTCPSGWRSGACPPSGSSKPWLAHG